MMLPRTQAERLRQLVGAFPVVVVVGARQVGKTTLVEHVLGNRWDTVTFDPFQDIGNARADPDLFLDNHPPPLFLDEIQYAPEVVGALKRRVDKRRRTPGQYVVSGSQQWEVMRRLADSLAGRAVFLDLEGFSLTEATGQGKAGHWLKDWLSSPERFLAAPPPRLSPPFPLLEQLWRGWLPEAQSLAAGSLGVFHQAYHRTYIERDVRALGAVDDWHQFDRFTRLLAALSGQEINYRQLGRDLGLAPTTAQRWLRMLVATFQWFENPPYHGNTIKRISGKPKGYLADTGQICFAQAISTPRALESHPLLGALFETAIAGEIRKGAGLLPTVPRVFHWRSHGGAEVDFLIEFDGRLHPIEAKLRSQPTRSDASGIRAMAATYPNARFAPGLIVAPANRFHQVADDVFVLPWDTAPGPG